MKKADNGQFLYEEITGNLRRRIISGEFKVGRSLPPEPDLARMFKVNRTTIRKVLGILSREGRIIRQHGRGTFVLDRRDKTRSIIYIGSMHTHGHSEQFAALYAAALERGWRLVGLDPDTCRERNAGLLKEYLMESEVVIVNSGYYDLAASELEQSHHRLIVIGLVAPRIARPAFYILHDLQRATQKAVDYLVSLGHRQIALATMGDWGTEANKNGYISQVYNDVYTAYRAGLILHGIGEQAQSILLRVQTHHETEDKKKLLDLLRQKNAPTAFICENDFRANLIYQAAAELNLNIPADISIVGMGNTPWCTTWIPQLTSVDYCRNEVADLVMHYCAGKQSDTSVVCRLEPRLIIRQSCSAPSGSKPKKTIRPRPGKA